jgi:hypothetical protein
MWSLCHSAVHDSPVSYLRSISCGRQT